VLYVLFGGLLRYNLLSAGGLLFPVYGVGAVALSGGWTGVRRRGAEAIVLGLAAGLEALLTSLCLSSQVLSEVSLLRQFFWRVGDTGSLERLCARRSRTRSC
jgi:hypothetical protein